MAAILKFPEKACDEWTQWLRSFTPIIESWGASRPEAEEVMRRMKPHLEYLNFPLSQRITVMVEAPSTCSREDAERVAANAIGVVRQMWSDEVGRIFPRFAWLEYEKLCLERAR